MAGQDTNTTAIKPASAAVRLTKQPTSTPSTPHVRSTYLAYIPLILPQMAKTSTPEHSITSKPQSTIQPASTDKQAQNIMSNERVILTTPRLLLRPAHNGDASALHTAFADPEVMRYWSIRHHETMADTRMFVDNMVASPQNGVTDFVIRRRSDPDQTTSPVIGKIGVYSASKPEIGFLIQRQYWRQGLVSEALTHILPYLFLKRGFNELTADIDPRNEACQGSLERFGFVVTGRRQRTYEIAGESVDSTDLRLTKEEHLVWAEKRQRRPR